MSLKKLYLRIYSRVRRLTELIGINSKIRQVETFPSVSEYCAKLLIIGSGQVSVPPDGWGAVETIIAETIPVFQKHGFSVKLVNSRAIQDMRPSTEFKPDVILVHDDISTGRVRRIYKNTPIISVTHYGLSAYPELWHSSYQKVIEALKFADRIICLNSEIKKSLSNYFDSNKLIVCANGTSFRSESGQKKGLGLICLGKIEPRKRQFELYQALHATSTKISFIGEIVDERVLKLISATPSAEAAFPGPWSRDEVQQRLKNYDGLILLSAGEADALVLYEAQVAGLPILVSEGALGSQDPTLDWIQVLNSSPTAEEIIEAMSKVESSHERISIWARENYSWEKRIANLLILMKDLSETK